MTRYNQSIEPINMKKCILSAMVTIGMLLSTIAVSQTEQPSTSSFKEQFNYANATDIQNLGLQKGESQVITLPISKSTPQEFTIEVKETSANNERENAQNYRIKSVNDKALNGYLYTSPTGVFITLYKNGQLTTIRPLESGSDTYVREVGSSRDWVCGNTQAQEISKELDEASRANLIQHGDRLYSYRLVVVATGEYYFANGNNDTDVMAAVNFGVNGINAIFTNDVSVEFDLVDVTLFDDSSDDPFTPDQAGGGPRTTQASTVIGSLYNSSQYDIGHVFHNHNVAINGGIANWGNGGIAQTPSSCIDFMNFKARAWSGAFFNNDNSFIALAAHEFGHQFGASHTFNGTGGSCTDAISMTTAYEIGSGTTLMSYNGICDPSNNIPSGGTADNYFHVHSLVQMIEHINGQGSCGSTSSINNNLPSSDANPCGLEYTIPRNTPFIIRGEGSDDDQDNQLTYCWEQYDEDGPTTEVTQGFLGNTAANSSLAPLHRSYPPTTTPIRYIPTLASVVAGEFNIFEVLSNRSRETTMRLTVRDNNEGNGAVAIDELSIDVDGDGPLTLFPGTIPDMVSGEMTTIEWEVNETEDLCNTVDILLSTDGGVTFNTTLASGVPYADADTGNSETLDITIPAGVQATEEARIMLVCADNDCVQFYSVSSQDATITSECNNPSTSICNTESIVANVGDPSLDLDEQFISGDISNGIRGTLSIGDNQGPVVNMTSDGSCNNWLNFQSRFISDFSVTESGTYTFSTTGATQYFSIHNADTYNDADPCSSFSTANTIDFGGPFSELNSATISLDQCEQYRIVTFTSPSANIDININVGGPGFVFADNATNLNYSYTFVAINLATNSILGVSDVADFTTLPGGQYEVYAVSYKSSGAEPPVNLDPSTWSGQSINEILDSGGCILQSNNFVSLDIDGGCSILDVNVIDLDACIDGDQFDLVVEVIYDQVPDPGTLEINGESFVLTGSPQTVILSNLPADGSTFDLNISIPEDPTCVYSDDIVIQSPATLPIINEVTTMSASGCTTPDGSITIEMTNTGNFTYILQTIGSPDEVISSTNTFDGLAPGLYMVEVQTNDICVDDNGGAIITVEGVNNLTAIIDEPVVEYCFGEILPTTVNTNTGTIFTWIDLTDPLTVLSNTDTFTPTVTGLYRVTVEDPAGCVMEALLDVTINEELSIELPDDAAICQFDDFILSTDPINGLYNWTFNEDDIPSSNSNSITISQPGQYILEAVEFGTDCSARDTFNLSLIAVPEFELGDDQSFCVGEEVAFDVSGEIFITNPVYTWTAPDNTTIGNNANITIDGSNGTGDYTLTVIDSDTDCSFSDVVNLEFVDTPTVTLDNDEVSFCQGENVTIIAASTFTEITWIFNDSQLIDVTDFFVTIDEPGQLIAEVGFGDCIGRDTVDITVSQLPPVLFSTDEIAGCEGDGIILDASNELDDFNWFINEILVEEDGDDEFTANVEGQYVAVATNDIGCTNSDTIDVFLNPIWEIDLGNDTIVCPDGSYTINAITDGPQVLWLYNEDNPNEPGVFPDDFAGLTALPSIECDLNESGIWIAQTERGECQASDTVRITKETPPAINLPIVSYLCGDDDEVSISSPLQDDTDYEWFLDVDAPPVATGNEVIFDEAGLYTLVATRSGTLCSSSETTAVSAAPIDFSLGFTSAGMILNELNDTVTVCGNNSLNITASSEEFATYQWFNELGGSILGSNTLFTINDNSDGRYYVEYTHNNSGCTNIDSFYVDYDVLPAISLEDATICDGAEFVMDTGLEGFTHIWIKDNVTIDGETTNQLTITESGNYFVGYYLTDETCIATDEFTVSTMPSPVVLPLEDGSICSGEALTLEVVSDGNYTYQWYLDDEIVIGATESVLDADVGGFYEVIISTLNGECRDTLQSTVIESFIDGLDIGDDDIALCPGETVILSPLDGEFANYQWSTGETTSSIELVAQEVPEITVEEITVVVDNGDGCILTDAINVINFPTINSEIRADVTQLCPTDTLELVAIGGLYYNWTEGSASLNATDTASVIASPTMPTLYVVEVTDDCPDNFDTDTLFVDVFPMAETSAGVDTCAFEGFPFELMATGGVEYVWSNTNLIQGQSDIPNPTISITSDATFTVTITDEFGCVYVESVDVCVRDEVEDLIDIVTIITPNGDGKNDVLRFNGLEAYPSNTLSIYNRWGNVVYSARDYQRNGDILFDGTNGTDELAADTYYYILEFNGVFIKEALTITR